MAAFDSREDSFVGIQPYDLWLFCQYAVAWG